MLASYLLSRTLGAHDREGTCSRPPVEGAAPSRKSAGPRRSRRSNGGFERVRHGYQRLLTVLVGPPRRLHPGVPGHLCIRVPARRRDWARTFSRIRTVDSSPSTCGTADGARASRRPARLTDLVEAGDPGAKIPRRRDGRDPRQPSGSPTAASTGCHSSSGVIGAADADVLVSLKARPSPPPPTMSGRSGRRKLPAQFSPASPSTSCPRTS